MIRSSVRFRPLAPSKSYSPRKRVGFRIYDGMPPEDHYVYILVSEADPSRHYTGCTIDLVGRLKKHNSAGIPHTSKYRPWHVETAIRFRSRDKARAFEAYLKSGSGREFARRHF